MKYATWEAKKWLEADLSIRRKCETFKLTGDKMQNIFLLLN